MNTKGMFQKNGRQYDFSGCPIFSHSSGFWESEDGLVKFLGGNSCNVTEQDGWYWPSISFYERASPIYGEPAKSLKTAKRRALRMAIDNTILVVKEN